MNDVARHYRELLGEVYPWMVKSRGNPTEAAAEWLRDWRLLDGHSYLDLGAGFGAHAEALLRAEKVVTVVDFDASLARHCEEALRPWIEGHLAEVVQADLVEYLERAETRRWDVILCTGDTLSHLPDHRSVESLIESAAKHLEFGGALVLEWRDSTRFGLEGSARFIEVARDETRTMHCFLEPLDDERMRVTDLVTDVTPEGPRTRISDYVKVRIGMNWLREVAARLGLTVDAAQASPRMCTLVLRN